MLQMHLNLVQSRMRVFGLKAQEIPAMQVIGKPRHIGLKAFARNKQLVFAAGHGSERLWNIFLIACRAAASFSMISTLIPHSSLLLARAVSNWCETYGENGSAKTNVLVVPTSLIASSILAKWLP